ncbi:hypothetical protein ABFZ85_12100 [Hyphococcus formosus]|uniref:hypothetical protein n=1 Tax=Hyphococcus formosus TaxID=3143534 RepID=UPI00398BB8ED
MTGKNQQSMLDALQASANTAFARLRGEPQRRDAATQFDNADPTETSFPSDNPTHEREGALPLSARLEESAKDIVRRSDDLRLAARGLTIRIAERRAGEVTMLTHGLRFLIGLVWLGIATWLFYGVMTARANGVAVTAGGIPVSDAIALVELFLMVAAAGLGVALAVGFLTRILGNADNRRIRAEAETLGIEIAKASMEFDRDLTDLRAQMDNRNAPADAVIELSRAHLTALEACAYFREIAFLTGAEGDHAQRLFKGFLNRNGGNPKSVPIVDFGLGTIFGVFLTLMFILPKPAPAEIVETLGLAQYPWAVQVILLGAFLYAIAGLLMTLMAAPLTEGTATTARTEALDALRSSFTAQEAPRPADVVRRTEDLLDVFRARVGGRTPTSGGRKEFASGAKSANQSAFTNEEESIPAWRRRDSSVRFVETGFAGAPERWRTDAFSKNFSGTDRRDTESKRGQRSLKNPEKS